jgi:hypothetical protein
MSIRMDQQVFLMSSKMNRTRFSLDYVASWGAMILAVFAAATLGPVFKYIAQHGVDPITAASWRCQCMLLFLAPLAYLESISAQTNRVKWFERKPTLKYPLFIHVLIGKCNSYE